MTETMEQLRTVTANQLRQFIQIGNDIAVVLSAMPRSAALSVRVELIRLVDACLRSPRQVGLPADNSLSMEVRRIAERLAEILHATRFQEHSILWACFGGAARLRQEMDEFVADWACALREES
jgi:hypothetical protein